MPTQPDTDSWPRELQEGRPDVAWDLFLDRYRRLIFAAIRHYATDYDDVMDVFARVCEALREDDMRRLRAYATKEQHRAAVSTWLVTVVRNLTIDWFRHRDGRHRVSLLAGRLPPLERRIFEHVFLDRRSHVEAYELIRERESPALTFREFLSAVRHTYAAVTAGRRGRLFAEVGVPLADDAELPFDGGDDALEQGEVLEEALSSLSAEDRTAVELYVVDGLPATDVARIVGFSNGKAVYNRVYRALAELRARLELAGVRREHS